MKLRVLSISNKAAAWSQQGVDHFMSKFPKGFRPELVELSPNKSVRDKHKKLLLERDLLRNRIDASSRMIVLDEAGVALIQGTAFGKSAKDNVRMNFTVSEEIIENSLEKINKILNK